ncbi:MAG TPA: PAS domain S-box protein, partial [Bacteroidia bacterium]|nr:PAS domain S-box protein [Bacteroidia bacterium]
MSGFKNNWSVILGSIILLVLIFLADFLTKGTTSIPVLYVLPVLITVFYTGRRLTLYNSLLATLLCITGYSLTGFQNNNVINLFIAITGIWVGFIFIVGYKNHALAESKSKERLTALFDYATEGILIANKKGEIVLINPIAEQLFGYERGELEGKQIEILIPERMSERHVKHREKYIQDPYPRSMGQGMELYARRKDNSEFPVEISLSNFENADGAFVIAFIIDISQRKQTEELLRQEKELAQMYLDIAPVIFVVTDKNENVVLINQNGCRILGYPESEIIGKNWFTLFSHQNESPDSKKLFQNLLEGKMGAMGSIENEFLSSKNEKKIISWKNTIIRDEKGNAVALLSAGEDITDKKFQQNLIEKANIDLKHYSDEILKLNTDLEKRVKERTEELAEVIKKLEHTNSELAIEIR